MTTMNPAAAAREAARTPSGQFGTQARSEADVDLAPAPEPYVQLVTHPVDMDRAAAAATGRGWTRGEVSWPRESGEENKRTDFIPTPADAHAIRSLLEAHHDAPVAVYWAESEWTEDGDDRLTTDVFLVVEAGDENGPSDTIYEVETGGAGRGAARAVLRAGRRGGHRPPRPVTDGAGARGPHTIRS